MVPAPGAAHVRLVPRRSEASLRRSVRVAIVVASCVGACAAAWLGGVRSRRARVLHCVSARRPSDVPASEWHALPGPAAALEFAVVWNSYFQVYEMSFRNSRDRAVRFEYRMRADGAPPTPWRGRWLGPGQRDQPPGPTVTGAAPGGRVCVWMRRVRVEPVVVRRLD